MNQVSDKFGLFYNENLMTAGDYYPAPQYLTLNDLYSRAYEGLALMLFSDIDTWPHATSITGFENVAAFDDQQQYLGVDVDQWGNVVYELPVRSNNSTEAQFNTTTTYAATSNPSEALSKAEAALASAKVDLAVQQAKADGAKANLDSANQQVATDQTALTQAQERLTTAQGNLTKANQPVANDQAAVDQAQTNLTKANQAVASAQQNLAAATAGHEAQLAVLKQAQANLATEQAKLAPLQDALKKSQAAQQTRLAQERALQEVENQAQGLKQTSSAVTLSKASNKQAPVKTTEQQLPQTGNDEGLLASALGMVLMALATAFGIQKRKED